jgi:hypothetical protein
MASGLGPTKTTPASAHARGIGVFREEAVAGVDGLGAGPGGRLQHEVRSQVGVGGRGAGKVHGLIGLQHVGRIAVGVAVQRDGGDVHRARRADDPGGDLAAIGDQ